MPTSFHLPLILLTLIVIAPYFLATARPIKPELNLAVPGFLSERTGSDSSVVPCAMSSGNGEVPFLKRFELAGNYGSLFLSALPKGAPVPPSGPNPRTNDLNN
ncbi:hypothetical protein SSX86_018196 [Deinandra increscens subsp. villosa]|uniref:Uncharacterized protein n=1 Tax=Deinandra increscens subsp. villosa TaxID=3103831 RepID=A0AAP0CQ96_9ASTR